MRPRRVYLPLSSTQVRELARTRTLAAPLSGFAAAEPQRTDVRRSAAAEEEAEYAAFAAAAAQAHEADPQQRRIVVAADAPATDLNEVEATDEGVGEEVAARIVTTADLPIRFIVSLHIDPVGSSGPDPLDLLWYDITELDTVVEELDRL